MMENDYPIGQCYICKNRKIEGNKLYCIHPCHRNKIDAYCERLNNITRIITAFPANKKYEKYIMSIMVYIKEGE